jgi:hypothetical protein
MWLAMKNTPLAATVLFVLGLAAPQIGYADPITIFSFSSTISGVNAPPGGLEALLGRSFETGDVISGRIMFETTPVPDVFEDCCPDIGRYNPLNGRIELDVPTSFGVDPLIIDVVNGAPSDILQFIAGDVVDVLGIPRSLAINAYWFDPLGTALPGDEMPTDPAVRSRFTGFGLALIEGFSPGEAPRTWLVAEGPAVAAIPEPGTLTLVGVAGAAAMVAARRKRKHTKR